jgi:hypothetical protein
MIRGDRVSGGNAAGNDGRDTSGDWVRLYRKEYGSWERNPRYRTTPAPPVKASEPEIQLAQDVREVTRELVALLLKKHQAYGPKNISQAPGGAENGLRVRMWDKMARLNHILDNPGVDTNDESLDDTLKDLANYCMIFMLVRRQQWPAQ